MLVPVIKQVIDGDKHEIIESVKEKAAKNLLDKLKF